MSSFLLILIRGIQALDNFGFFICIKLSGQFARNARVRFSIKKRSIAVYKKYKKASFLK